MYNIIRIKNVFYVNCMRDNFYANVIKLFLLTLARAFEKLQENHNLSTSQRPAHAQSNKRRCSYTASKFTPCCLSCTDKHPLIKKSGCVSLADGNSSYLLIKGNFYHSCVLCPYLASSRTVIIQW